MKFSTKTTYGLRSIVFLASAEEGKNISLSSISNQEGISLKYLERIFSCLKKAGLVNSEKGVSGGYVLAKSSSDITVFDVIESLEGDMGLFHCIGANGKVTCSSKCNCAANGVLKKVEFSVNKALINMTIKDLL